MIIDTCANSPSATLRPFISKKFCAREPHSRLAPALGERPERLCRYDVISTVVYFSGVIILIKYEGTRLVVRARTAEEAFYFVSRQPYIALLKRQCRCDNDQRRI